MIIDKTLLDTVSDQAKASPRLRMNYNYHQSLDEKCHRFLNAVEPGTEVPIHRHRHTSETVVCLRGRLVWEFYQELRDEGLELRDSSKSSRVQKVQEIELSPNGRVVALNIPAGQWHTVRGIRVWVSDSGNEGGGV